MAKQTIKTTVHRRTRKNSGNTGGKVVQCNMCRGTGYVVKRGR